MARVMPRLISLGFSCQSRFLLNCLTDDSPSMPFDWLITSKQFLLSQLLAKDGSGFCKDVSELEVHRMPGEQIEGLGKDGVWFWHDFPRTPDEKSLRGDYRDYNDLSGKYRYLWARFIASITADTEPKRFILSNTHANLVEYASSAEDFRTKFRIDSEYLHALRGALDGMAVRNYQLTCLVRSMDEYLELSRNSANHACDVRFAGPLSLPLKPVAAAAMVAGETGKGMIGSVLGKYNNGLELVQSGCCSALLLNEQEQPLAVARISDKWVSFAFSGGVDSIIVALRGEDTICFPSGAAWRRTSA